MPSKEWKEQNPEKMQEYRRDWYARNKDHAKAKVVERKQRLLEWFRQYKRTLKCQRCGETHPACLEFHHRDPSEKNGLLISRLIYVKGWSKERIMREVAKCDVLCANCHRKLHSSEDEAL